MKILSNDLIGLPVFTESGRNLGRIDSFEIDIDINTIINYHVSTGMIKGLWHQKLIISQSQVISISREKMTVEDGIIKEPAVDLAASPVVK